MLRSYSNYDRREVSDRNGVSFEGPDGQSRTVQSEKDNCDINVIMRRFGKTGQMPPNIRVPQYADYEGITDFQTAMNVVSQAREGFLALPAAVRSRFGNDPQAYLSFVSDPKNIDDLRKLGLAKYPKKDVELPPTKVVVVSEEGDGRVSEGAKTGASASGKSA